ncbi:hypothetical protein bgla_1g24690 [Burkholderia gladioli BSR3]|uniref:Uncharacterized protein n=2 Tax=Burkholderia gladioli TaxID=28095 RepID=F2LES6_BURGS|nr:hypothetical protein bgla_1g24690 [Burkholderia gladioli BSR3]
MRILCQSNTGASLPENARCRGETDRTEFAPLKVGDEYIVYGLMFLFSRVDFLVCPGGAGPYWMPSNLFSVTDSALPVWRICLTEQVRDYQGLLAAFGITALIGYDALVSDYQHYVGIIERDPVQLQRFIAAKQSIDQWQNA